MLKSKTIRIVLNILTLLAVFWGLWEQTKAETNVWIQIIAVVLFFAAMARLSSKVSSNTVQESPAEREFNTGIKKDLLKLEKEDKKDVE
ncbi:hypothetical protein [Myroides pelagicus]|uniref:Uncharacterized protein n=1 Tax=Myroides pelagicus TaxID=270914 RepID=A0A7K1GP87_9FLAO|nr:hypothetical protein [Myroides pelagicus]MEC4113845.1 hypothetical protein [Myroides pelagicus]MTH30656.1 hypothetical protein [Myroides pelagicus]